MLRTLVDLNASYTIHRGPFAKYDPYLPILGVNVDLINSLHDRDNAIVFSLCNVQ